MIKLLQSERAQRIGGWVFWFLFTASALVLIFTGINQEWDAILLRASTGAMMVAGALAKLLPKAIVNQITGDTQEEQSKEPE